MPIAATCEVNIIRGLGCGALFKRNPKLLNKDYTQLLFAPTFIAVIPILRLGLYPVWESICFNMEKRPKDLQSLRWLPGVCAGLSGEDPSAESRRPRTFPEAASAACEGSHRTFHRYHGCRKEAEQKGCNKYHSYVTYQLIPGFFLRETEKKNVSSFYQEVITPACPVNDKGKGIPHKT